MAWTASGAFNSFKQDLFQKDILPDFNADAFRCALYSTTPTPNFDDTTAHNCYLGAGGQWAANQTTDALAQWATAGEPAAGLTGLSVTRVTKTMTFDANDVTKAGTTITGAAGCLLYDDTLAADNGIFAIWFGAGGPYSTVAGTFTIAWSSAPSAIYTWADA